MHRRRPSKWSPKLFNVIMSRRTLKLNYTRLAHEIIAEIYDISFCMCDLETDGNNVSCRDTYMYYTKDYNYLLCLIIYLINSRYTEGLLGVCYIDGWKYIHLGDIFATLIYKYIFGITDFFTIERCLLNIAKNCLLDQLASQYV